MGLIRPASSAKSLGLRVRQIKQVRHAQKSNRIKLPKHIVKTGRKEVGCMEEVGVFILRYFIQRGQ